MSVLKGLKAFEQLDRTYVSDGPKVRWLKLEDGKSIKARFVNELDDESPNYNSDFDVAIVISEHTNPADYRKKAVCTMESEGRCFGCEMARKQTEEERKKGSWRARFRYYTNLLVDDGIEDPYVAVWSQGIGNKSAFQTIREYALDTGSITNREWKMTRKGSDQTTTYLLIPRDPDTDKFDWSDVEPFDLMKVVREIPYAEQEQYYLGFDSAVASDTKNLDW